MTRAPLRINLQNDPEWRATRITRPGPCLGRSVWETPRCAVIRRVRLISPFEHLPSVTERYYRFDCEAVSQIKRSCRRMRRKRAASVPLRFSFSRRIAGRHRENRGNTLPAVSSCNRRLGPTRPIFSFAPLGIHGTLVNLERPNGERVSGRCTKSNGPLHDRGAPFSTPLHGILFVISSPTPSSRVRSAVTGRSVPGSVTLRERVIGAFRFGFMPQEGRIRAIASLSAARWNEESA
jgi:hypothetical protein